VRDVGNGVQSIQRPDRAAAEIGCLLDDDEPLARCVRPFRPDRRGELCSAEDAATACERLDHHASERGRPTAFEADDVRGGVADDFLPGTAVHGECDLVCHRAGWQEYAGFFAEQFRAAFDEMVDRRVFMGTLVADFGGGHDGAHRGSRAGFGVAGEVYEGGHGAR
jgi:hypothetical protein